MLVCHISLNQVAQKREVEFLWICRIEKSVCFFQLRMNCTSKHHIEIILCRFHPCSGQHIPRETQTLTVTVIAARPLTRYYRSSPSSFITMCCRKLRAHSWFKHGVPSPQEQHYHHPWGDRYPTAWCSNVVTKNCDVGVLQQICGSGQCVCASWWYNICTGFFP